MGLEGAVARMFWIAESRFQVFFSAMFYYDLKGLKSCFYIN